MKAYVKGTDVEIVGVLQGVIGTQPIYFHTWNERDYVFQGDFQPRPETQFPETDATGRTLFVGSDGDLHTEDKIEMRPDPEHYFEDLINYLLEHEDVYPNVVFDFDSKITSRSNGAWVQAWVKVEFAGTPFDKVRQPKKEA